MMPIDRTDSIRQYYGLFRACVVWLKNALELFRMGGGFGRDRRDDLVLHYANDWTILDVKGRTFKNRYDNGNRVSYYAFLCYGIFRPSTVRRLFFVERNNANPREMMMRYMGYGYRVITLMEFDTKKTPADVRMFTGVYDGDFNPVCTSCEVGDVENDIRHAVHLHRADDRALFQDEIAIIKSGVI